MALEYITTRALEGKVPGKIRIVKMSEEAFAQIDFTCPECGSNQKRNEEWKEPFVAGEGSKQKFFVTCAQCKTAQKFLKLKKEAKKK